MCVWELTETRRHRRGDGGSCYPEPAVLDGHAITSAGEFHSSSSPMLMRLTARARACTRADMLANDAEAQPDFGEEGEGFTDNLPIAEVVTDHALHDSDGLVDFTRGERRSTDEVVGSRVLLGKRALHHSAPSSLAQPTVGIDDHERVVPVRLRAAVIVATGSGDSDRPVDGVWAVNEANVTGLWVYYPFPQ
jgi:hypothetical protein